jgi:hypothetical protein
MAKAREWSSGRRSVVLSRVIIMIQHVSLLDAQFNDVLEYLPNIVVIVMITQIYVDMTPVCLKQKARRISTFYFSLSLSLCHPTCVYITSEKGAHDDDEIAAIT